MLTILLNNHPLTLPPGSCVSDALAAFAPIDGLFALALNDEFLPKARYSQQTLNNGDTIDLVAPVGGG